MLIDTTPIASALKELQPIELQQVRRTGDEPLFNSLMEQHTPRSIPVTFARNAAEEKCTARKSRQRW
jgi:hypothetical protein